MTKSKDPHILEGHRGKRLEVCGLDSADSSFLANVLLVPPRLVGFDLSTFAHSMPAAPSVSTLAYSDWKQCPRRGSLHLSV